MSVGPFDLKDRQTQQVRAAAVEHTDADTLLKFVDDVPGQVNLLRHVYRRLVGGHRTGRDET